MKIIDMGHCCVPQEVKIMPKLMMKTTKLTMHTKINHDKDIM